MTRKSVKNMSKDELLALQAEITEQMEALAENEKQNARELANAKIADNLSKVRELVNECEALASAHDLSFSFDVAGYGMGGWFESGEWQASSQSC